MFLRCPAVSVLNQYINNFLPQAIELNAAIGQATNNTDSYVYTTHAWVIRLLWECGQEGGGKEDEGIGIRYGGKIRCPDETTQRRVGLIGLDFAKSYRRSLTSASRTSDLGRTSHAKAPIPRLPIQPGTRVGFAFNGRSRLRPRQMARRPASFRKANRLPSDPSQNSGFAT